MFKYFLVVLAFLLNGCTSYYNNQREKLEIDEYGALARHTVRIDVKQVYATIVDGVIKLDKKMYSSTGVVVDVKENKSLIMTAGHTCNLEKTIIVKENDKLIPYQAVGQLFKVASAMEDKSTVAMAVYKDKKIDFCLLIANKAIGTPVKFGKRMPSIFSKLQYVGGPRGFIGGGNLFVSSGRLIGYSTFNNTVYGTMSAPSTFGVSGSGIFYKGKIVGLLTNSNSNFHHLTLFITLKDLDQAFKRAFD